MINYSRTILAMQSEAATEDFRPDKRLHPLSWLFVFMQFNKAVIPLFIAVLVGSRRESFIGLAVVGMLMLPGLLNSLWIYFTYRYGFSERGLVIREGVFFRNVRTIDYARIENIDTRRGVFHRMFRVAQVQIETSSGGSAEATIRVLSLQAVEELRSHIFEQKAQYREVENTSAEVSLPVAQHEELLLALSPGELVRIGLIDNRGLVIVAAVVALLADSGLFRQENFLELIYAVTTNELTDLGLPQLGWVTTTVAAMVLFLLLVFAIRILSVIWAFVTFYDFKLSRQGADMFSQYGLLTRVSVTLRQRRVQVIHQTSTLLHRLFNRTSLQVDLAGGISAEMAAQNTAGEASRQVWLAPLCRPENVSDLVRAVLPQVQLADLNWQGLAPRARWRIFRLQLSLWIIFLALPAAWFTGWWSVPVVGAGTLFVWLHASLYVKYTAWAITSSFFIYRRGWLTRKTSIVPLNRVQSVRLIESPFDRRQHMASLAIDTAGALNPGRRIRILYLDLNSAKGLAAAIYNAAIKSNTPDGEK